MAYLYSTPDQQTEMLDVIGVSSIEDLLSHIPPALRLEGELDVPPALTEPELEAHVRHLARRNRADRVCFQGGGAYDHFVPAVVDEIAGRGEFYTAYTPYQPEASQGSLQAFFEFQTLICQLTGLDVANASLYEGGTAVSEAAFMAMRCTRRHKKILVSEALHPEYRQILRTYTHALPAEVVTIPAPHGVTDLNRAEELIDEETACLLFQHPNFFGCLESPEQLSEIAHRHGALSVVSFDPISLGLLKRPGDYGADIGVAEGQPLGVPLQYGGPYLGILACRDDFVRKIPGRLIARAIDRDGRDCYVLGLQTREQHIRRDKATSNICTNQGLLALRATTYLSLMGPRGMREAAELCCRKAHYAAERMTELDGVELMYETPFFKEFALRFSGDTGELLARARSAGFDLGPELHQFPCLRQAREGVLVAVTEKRTRDEIDGLVSALANEMETND